MILTLEARADAQRVRAELAERGVWVSPLIGGASVQLLVEPHSPRLDPSSLLAIAGVASVSAPESPHPLVDGHPASIEVDGIPLSGPALIAGPCSIESAEQIDAIAERTARAGSRWLRGGAFKPRTSPYSFQGYGEAALRWMRAAADRYGQRVVTEVLAEQDVELVARYADVLQVGSRNMQNFALLRRAAAVKKPMLLKRGMAATLSEWLQAGEYCLLYGASAVVFCERGIRSFDPTTRNLLDLGAVAQLAHVHRLPVVVDPSHGAGRRDLIAPLARAAVAAGACGVMVETHDQPGSARSDGPQALPPEPFAALAAELQPSKGAA